MYPTYITYQLKLESVKSYIPWDFMLRLAHSDVIQSNFAFPVGMDIYLHSVHFSSIYYYF